MKLKNEYSFLNYFMHFNFQIGNGFLISHVMGIQKLNF